MEHSKHFPSFSSILLRKVFSAMTSAPAHSGPAPFKDEVLRPQPDTVSVSYEPQSCNSLQRQEASNHSAPVN